MTNSSISPIVYDYSAVIAAGDGLAAGAAVRAQPEPISIGPPRG